MTSIPNAGTVTVLHTAIKTGQLEIIKATLDQCSRIAGNTLHLAVLCSQIEVTRLLITKYNCPVDSRNKRKQTPLHIACSKGHLSMV